METATKTDSKSSKSTAAANSVKPKAQEQDTRGYTDMEVLEAEGIQAKLTIGQPGDKYEQEADHVADQVVSMPAPDPVQKKCESCEAEEKQIRQKPLAANITPWVQRQAEERPAAPEEEKEVTPKFIQKQAEENPSSETMEDEQEQPPVQAKRFSSETPGTSFESRLNNSKGSGDPLPDDTRSFMETRMGADFSDVKVHTGGSAVQMNKELGSQAFTNGNDVYFNQGKFDPGSNSGKRLLAHELTVQQESGEHPPPKAKAEKSSKVDQIKNENKSFMVSELSVATAEGTAKAIKKEGQPNILVPSKEVKEPPKDQQAKDTLSPSEKKRGDKTVAQKGKGKKQDEPEEKTEAKPLEKVKKPKGGTEGVKESSEDSQDVQMNDEINLLDIKDGQEVDKEKELSTSSIRELIPVREPTLEEFTQVFVRGESEEQQQAEVNLLLSQFQMQAQTEKNSLIATSESKKQEIQTNAETEISGIEASLVSQIAQTSKMFAQSRGNLRSEAESQKAAIQLATANDIAKAKADTHAKVMEAETLLDGKKNAFEAFMQNEKQEPNRIVDKEIKRAHSELDSAASDCIRAGERVAGRYPGNDDSRPEQRQAARQVGRESASDIRSKKSTFGNDYHRRAVEFSGKYAQYKHKVNKNIEEVRLALIPGLREKGETIVTELEKGKVAVLKTIDQRVLKNQNELRKAENDKIGELKKLAKRSKQQIRKSTSETIKGIESSTNALVSRMDSIIEGTIQVLTNQADPYVPSLRNTALRTQLHLVEIADGGKKGLNKATSEAKLTHQKTGEKFGKASIQIRASGEQLATTIIQSTTKFCKLQAKERQTRSIKVIASLIKEIGTITKETLAELETAISQVRSEVRGLTSKFRKDIVKATDQSIKEAIKPKTDQVEDRAAQAAKKAGASWWEGLLSAIGDIVVGLVVLVVVALVVAAIAAVFGVILTAWGAIMIAGAILLLVGLGLSLYSRFSDTREGARDLPWYSKIGLAVTDTIGVTGIYQAISGKDIATGDELSAGERVHGGVTGTFGLIMLFLGGRALIKGPPPGGVYSGSWSVPKGWAGWRSAGMRGLRTSKSVAIDLYVSFRKSGGNFIEWIKKIAGRRSHAPEEPVLPPRPEKPGPEATPEETAAYKEQLKEWMRQKRAKQQYDDEFSTEAVENAEVKITDKKFQEWWDNATPREKQLALDAAHKGEITNQGVSEAIVGLEAEANGSVKGPIRRSTNAGEEFIDGNGKPWDVKSWENGKSIAKDLMLDESIIVDGKGNMTASQFRALKNEVAVELTNRGRGDLVPSLDQTMVPTNMSGSKAPPISNTEPKKKAVNE